MDSGEQGEVAPGGPGPRRWGTDPERIDPDDYPPAKPFVKQMTWAQCSGCQLQVHLPLTQFLLQGLICPSCGSRLLEPPEDGPEQLARVLRREDVFSEQID
jgi:hypothetical protein